MSKAKDADFDAIKREVYTILSANQDDSLVAKIETGGHFQAFLDHWMVARHFGFIDCNEPLHLNAFFSISEKAIIMGAIVDAFAQIDAAGAALRVGKQGRDKFETIESDVYHILSARQLDSLKTKIETGDYFQAFYIEYCAKKDQDFLHKVSRRTGTTFCRSSLNAFSEEEKAIVFGVLEDTIRLSHEACELRRAVRELTEIGEAERNKQKRMQEEKKKDEEEKKKEEEKEKKRKKQEVADAQAAVTRAETTAVQQAHREETDQLAKERQKIIEAGRKALSEAKQAEKKADEAQRLADKKAKLEADKEKKRQATQEKKRLNQLECLSPAQKRRLGAADDDDAEEKPPKKGKKK